MSIRVSTTRKQMSMRVSTTKDRTKINPHSTQLRNRIAVYVAIYGFLRETREKSFGDVRVFYLAVKKMRLVMVTPPEPTPP
eukprot:scaffold2387_cov106-Amphora_coffeaeformis.AAC.5